jgi:hypothetical protein
MMLTFQKNNPLLFQADIFLIVMLSSAKVKKTWRYTSTPQNVFMSWCLVKHRDNFTLCISHILLQSREASGYSAWKGIK